MFFGAYQESKLALGLSSKNYLKVIRGRYNVGGVIPFMAADHEVYYRFCYTNLKNEQTIYEQTQAIIKELASDYSGEPIFFKTEFNSIDSYVWRYAEGGILLYRINPDQTEAFTIKKNQLDSLPRRFKTPDLFLASDAIEGTVLGVAQSQNGRIEYKTTTINLRSFLEDYQDEDFLESFMKKDLYFIRDYLNIPMYRWY